MIETTKLTTDQLLERASNKLEAKLFFAHKSLQEIELEIEGVISSKMSNDILRKNYQAKSNEVQTLTYLFDIIEKKIDKKACVLNKKQLTLTDVSQQRELLRAYAELIQKDYTNHFFDDAVKESIDQFLSL
jgi:hypothetical protein